LAACGVFQVSQHRGEVEAIFGPSIPTFSNAHELQRLLGTALADPDACSDLAALAHELVAPHTYAARAAQALADLEQLGAAQSKGA
jgi:spore maturation protein CgeB